MLLHDGVVVAVVLHLPQAICARGRARATTRRWVTWSGRSTARPNSPGLRGPYVAVAGGFVRFAFAEGGWKARGNLRAVTFVAQRPGEAPNPEADDCPTCADLPVRGADRLDVPATVAAVDLALASGRLARTHRCRWPTCRRWGRPG